MSKKARPKKPRPGLEGLVAKPGAAARPSAMGRSVVGRLNEAATDAATKLAEMDHPEGLHRAFNEVRQVVGPVFGAVAANAPTSAPASAPKALTVKLEPGLYRRLRLHAAETDRTHQAILVDALRAYLGEA
jgi:hypothetical protein